MCTLYNLKREEIDKEEFVELYSKYYFTAAVATDAADATNNKNKNTEDIYIKNKTYEPFENYVMEILDNGIQNPDDLFNVLVWKMGLFRHSKAASDSAKECDFSGYYYKNCKLGDDSKLLTITRYGNVININDLIDIIKIPYSGNGICFLKSIVDKKEASKGLGIVYLITLLFFVSKGRYPIYDQYVDIALDAIINNKKPKFSYRKDDRGDYVRYTAPQDKSYIENFFNERYYYSDDYKSDRSNPTTYMDKLHYIFSNGESLDDFKVSREIDRALWVYGHGFKTSGDCK